ncbi:CdaR family protein [Bombilactobacillus folatiphilus]|uniref:CdaR family protein n=1 Tax=Bombilactobacillus folatiphilus TaxID=2923362 RepID=A0ABY4P7H1_9LACO|nr:CdaR family protein [Bombilactobacillus folatiphilus]UQS81650.1 CdaR family protein [Bombilactobacillus folatiphilus]
MKKWRKFVNSKYFYLTLSFLIALWIYWSVSLPSIGSTRSSTNNSTMNANETATEQVKLQVNSDSENYFITGYPKQVKVKLEGPAALLTATKNTHNFTVYIDLHNLGVGHHRVLVRQNGLNHDLKYSIKPRYVDVDIEPKAQRVFPVQAEYDSKNVDSGYIAGDASVSPQVVQVVGARSEVQRISQVVARATLPKNTSSNFHQEVLLQALDVQGRTLSVVINPQTARVKVSVTVPSKKVAIKLIPKNNNYNKNYNLISDVKTVRIYARKKVLNQINELEIPVDVSKLDNKDSKVVTINQTKFDIIDSSPRTIKVYLKSDSDQSVSD